MVQPMLAALQRWLLKLLTFVAGAFVCSHVLSYISADSYSPNKQPLGKFYVALRSEDTQTMFSLVQWSVGLLPTQTLVPLTGQLSHPLHESAQESVHVVDTSATGSTVETVMKTDDYTITSRYVVTATQVLPQYRRVFSPGHVFTGMLLSLLCCAVGFKYWALRAKWAGRQR